MTWEPVLPATSREGCRSVGMWGWFLTLSLCPKHDRHCPLSKPQGSHVPGSLQRKKPRNFGVSPGKNLPGSKFLALAVAQPGAWPSLPFPALGMPQVSLTARVLISVGFSCSCTTWGPVGSSTHKEEQLSLPPAPRGVQLGLSVCRLKVSNRLKLVP